MSTAEPFFVYLVRFADGTFAGSPTNTRTSNPNLAGCFGRKDLARCQSTADALGGEIVKFQDGRVIPVDTNA